ncbi:MAG: hypothetical protein LKH69_08680, partial [Lachnospiraceae bacterium]|nr:hypothetical protein [Lachnospiraceae bacterium]
HRLIVSHFSEGLTSSLDSEELTSTFSPLGWKYEFQFTVIDHTLPAAQYAIDGVRHTYVKSKMKAIDRRLPCGAAVFGHKSEFPYEERSS